MPPRLPAPDVIAESGAVLVLNKPGGLLTQAPPAIDSLELRTRRWLIERDQKPGNAYVGVPHRLDRPVSGIMLMCKNVRAARRISEQLEQRTVRKTYVTIVSGQPDDESGTWIDFMRKVPDEARSEIVSSDHPDAKQAILHFQAIATDGNSTLLQIELETGRTHQIRLQCGSHGLPIVGDELYGSRFEFGPQTLDHRKRWIALHSRRIEFVHPMSKEKMQCVAPFSDHWNDYRSLTSALG
ncbi:MAG: RNA pseudouridine synthase [Planctomycetota bacterium]